MRVDEKHLAMMKGSWSWPDLLQALIDNPFRHRLLKTGVASGMFTDGSIVTKLAIEERAELRSMAKAAKASEKDYVAAEAFDLEEIMPGKLGDEIVKATFAGTSDKINLAWLHDASGRKAMIEAKALRTLMDRHPKATWRLAAGRFWLRPVVLLERDGFFKNQLLALAATVPIEPDPLPDPTPKKMVRVARGDAWYYDAILNQ